MSNVVLAVQVYTVTKESLPACSKTTCMTSHRLLRHFPGGCAEGGETSVTSKQSCG